MKLYVAIFTLLCICACKPLFGQNLDVPLKDSDDAESSKILPADSITEKPAFPGGIESKVDYLNKNFKGIQLKKQYQKKKFQKRKYYKISVAFIIEKDGSISNVILFRKYQLYFTKPDQQKIIDIFENMPKWIPGKIDGEPKRVRVLQQVRLSN